MRVWHWVILVALGAGLGYGVGWQMSRPHAGPDDANRSAERMGDGPCDGAAAEYWVAPMDASYRRSGPGKSPMGMDLVPVCGGRSDQDVDVSIDPTVVQHLGVRTAVVRRESLAPQIRATGIVALDADSVNMVHTRAAGWLEQLGVSTVGERVAPGDLLFSLFSPDLLAAEREYLSARGHRALQEAASDRLMALGYTREQIAALGRRGRARERSERVALTDWVVATLDARPGQFVTPGSMVMTLARLDRVWLFADVPAHLASLIEEGVEAEAIVPGLPGRQWSGRVDLLSPEIDARTRTRRVRLVFENPDEALVPGMYADVTLTLKAGTPVLTVPMQAVIRSGHGDRVVRVRAPGAYDVRPVTVGNRQADRIAVLEGLEAGDQVVVSGQFLIDSEANLDAETLRMRSAARPTGRAMATVRSVDPEAGTVRLAHGPLEPVGEAGLSMPGMTMDFHLGRGLDAERLTPGDQVRVHVEQQGPSRYVVTKIEAADHGEMDHGEMDHGEMDHGEMDHGDHGQMDHGQMDHGQMDHAESAGTRWTRAEVQGLHRGKRSVVLAHEMIHSIGMPPMTMGFSVAPGVDLEAVKEGMTVRIRVDMPSDGVYRITAMEPAP